MPKVSPYDDRFPEYSQEKIMKRDLKIAEKWLGGNDKISPQQMAKWLEEVKTDFWTNVRVQVRIREGDENNLESHYLIVTGDRLETDEEFKKRQEGIIIKWQSDYEQFLLKKNYYESDLGRAQIAEVKAKSKRRIRYPEGLKKEENE